MKRGLAVFLYCQRDDPCIWTVPDFPDPSSIHVLRQLLGLSRSTSVVGKVVMGNCVHLSSCPPLNKLAGKPTASHQNIVRASFCRFQAGVRVCCPDIAKCPPRSPSKPAVDAFDEVVTPTRDVLELKDSLHPQRHLLPGLKASDCGQERDADNRVSKGVDAGLGAFPWMVRLGYVRKYSARPVVEFICGGYLIAKQYVLTAAHCIVDGLEQDLELLGEYDTEQFYDCVIVGNKEMCSPGTVDVSIQDVIMHPEYGQPARYRHDIALIRLEKQVQFSDWIQPICLPFGNVMTHLTDNYNPIVAGWGNLGYGLPGATILQKAQVPLVGSASCKKLYGNIAQINHSQQFCASGNFCQDTCMGDSGGPLMVRDQSTGEPRAYAMGIVSFGPEACGEVALPGVYTWVPAYLQWILDNVKP